MTGERETSGRASPRAVRMFLVGTSVALVAVTGAAVILIDHERSVARTQSTAIQKELGNSISLTDLGEAGVVAADEKTILVVGKMTNGTITFREYARDDPRILDDRRLDR